MGGEDKEWTMLMMGQNIDHFLLITFTLLAFFSAVTGLVVVPRCDMHENLRNGMLFKNSGK